MNSIYSNFSFRAAGVALGVGLATVGMSLVSGVASAATVTSLPDFTDDQFDGLIDSGNFTELFVAEGRIGNAATNGDREFGINTANGNPVADGQYAWGSNQPVSFTLEYNGTEVTYTVAGIELTGNFSGSVDTIYLRTLETSNSDIQVDMLQLDGIDLVLEGTSDLAVSAPGNSDADGVDYLLIQNISQPFTLTGRANLSWTGTRPSGSHLAYQIKVGTSEPVPEPLTILGSGVALGFGALLKKESSKKQNKVK